ncbi:MAG TPA: hypothetical protein VF210_05205 [Pseudomonadales bacterium]
MKSFLCDIVLSCVLALPGARPIDELSYAAALYAWYQEQNDEALVEVLVAESRGRTDDDPVRWQLAKGSFAFAQGMYRFANESFETLAEGELSELDRMRLAFHLAREHYRRGDWRAVEAELERVDLGANWRGRRRRHPEVEFMRAEAALGQGDLARAEQALGALSEDDVWLAYGLFNLGVAQRAAGQSGPARATFERLARLRVETEEAWDLVQRGRLALAVMAREAGAAVDAQELLAGLPGDGRYRDVAMLSYGKLAMARGEYDLAARIWLTLLEQDGWSRGHAAARLGLPMSLEKLDREAQALERYRHAALAFEGRLAALEQAAARTDDPVWVDGLLDAVSRPDDTARAQELARLGAPLGAATWFEWLSGEDVHRVLSEWRELTGMAGWLAELPPRIAAYQEVTAERRRRTAEARVLLDDGELTARRDELAGRVGVLERALAELERETPRPEPDWMNRLATAEERALIDELTAMAALAVRLPAAERPRVEARIRRLIGLVFWQIADERAARIRALVRQLDESRALLAGVDARIERLEGAEARFAAGVEADFLALTERSSAVAERVAAALDERRRVIAAALRRGLDDEVARTRDYLLTARIAIARATDRLANGDAAPAARPAPGVAGS